MHFFSSLLLFQKQTKKQKNRKQKNRGAGEEDKKTRKKNRQTERSTERRRGAWLKKKRSLPNGGKRACVEEKKKNSSALLHNAGHKRARHRQTITFFSSSVLQFFFSSSSVLLLLSKRCVYIVWCISRFLCVFFVIDERWEIGGVSINRADVLAHSTDFSLSLIPIGETTFTRARAIYAGDTYIDSIRCVRLILTNPLLSSPSSSSRAVLFFLGSPAVSPLSLSLFRRGELTLARRADIARRRSSIRSVFAAERKSSLFDTRIG